MRYIKQLDSLRAIAVLLVIIGHWISEGHILNTFRNGVIGVDIFFVLSGFLISGILFNYRINLGANTKQILKVFYARRTLRIFPIYYITIILLLVFAASTKSNIKEDFIYYLTYTSNLNFFFEQKWDGMLSHLWSLAVEEQFYLIWPWVVLLVNRKYLIHAILLFIGIGVGSRFMLDGVPLSRVMTTSCFDSFGFGALLAYFVTYKKEYLSRLYRYSSILSVIIVLSMTVGHLMFSKSYWFILPAGTIHSILAMWFILFIYLNQETTNMLYRIPLNNRIMIFVGKISYGVYLFHNFVPEITEFLWRSVGASSILATLKTIPYGVFTINLMFLILISWLSFKFIEKPFLRMKRRFVID